MAYQLIGSINSPYVRKLRLFMMKSQIAFDFKAINIHEKEGAEFLRKINPIGKIPVFFDNDQVIYDSRVIFNYISKKHAHVPLTIEDENRISMVDGGAETGVSLFLLRQSGMDLNSPNVFIQRQKKRIHDILNYLEPWTQSLKDSDQWGFPEMGLYSFVNWIHKREIVDLKDHPAYLDFLKRYQNAPGVAETEMVL